MKKSTILIQSIGYVDILYILLFRIFGFEVRFMTSKSFHDDNYMYSFLKCIKVCRLSYEDYELHDAYYPFKQTEKWVVHFSRLHKTTDMFKLAISIFGDQDRRSEVAVVFERRLASMVSEFCEILTFAELIYQKTGKFIRSCVANIGTSLLRNANNVSEGNRPSIPNRTPLIFLKLAIHIE